MPTITSSKYGFVQGPSDATFSTANGASTGTATVNPTTATVGVEYRLQGRTSLLHSMNRSFFFFDTSGISVTPTSATLDLRGHNIVTNTPQVIVAKANAFSGDGSTDLSNDDFNNTTFVGGTAYSGIYSSWTTSGTNSISITSTGLTRMASHNSFICCLMQYANDYRQQGASSTTTNQNLAINFAVTPTLTYVAGTSTSGPANVQAINRVDKSNIEQFNGIAFTSIQTINGI